MSKEYISSPTKNSKITLTADISDHYNILDIIGEGTFGKVKSAIHIQTGEKVAIKFLEKNRIKDKEAAERVSREVTFLKKLKHENIIQLYEIFETNACIYLVMEYAKYGEFFNYIVESTRLQEEEASMFYVQVLQGIEYIHKHKIVHRDLKPENLLLNENKTLKLIDFGLSNSYEKGNVLKTPCGSPCYAAPEMLIGKQYSGLEIDIWSSGIILYAMVCGYLPFEDDNNTQLYKKIIECKLEFQVSLSENCMDFIRKLLTPNPKKRITIEQIKKHPFYFQGIEILKERRIEYDEEENHLQALRRLEGLGLNKQVIREHLRKGTYNNITTSYYLILNKIKYEKYLEIIDKRKVIINESDYAEEICGTESPVTGYTERKEDIEFLMFNQDENDYNEVVLLSEESKKQTPEIKKFIYNFEEPKLEYLKTDNNLQGSVGTKHITCKTETNVISSLNRKNKVSQNQKELKKFSKKKNMLPLSIKTKTNIKNIPNITPFSNKTSKNNYINFNNFVIQNTNYNININNLSSKTPKQAFSRDKNISIKPIQINIFNNTNTPNKKKMSSNFVVVDYNIDVLNPHSKKGSQNSSKEPILKKKSFQNDSNKEIIRLYTSSSVNKKKIINHSDNFNINFTNKFKPPSIEKIFPTSTKGVVQNMFSKLGINNLTNNLHNISKHSDNLFFKRKTDSSNYKDSFSPIKKTEALKFNPSIDKKNSVPTNKQFINSKFVVKISNPIKLSKPDPRPVQNLSEMSNSGRATGGNEYIQSLKDRVISICNANKIKIKAVDEKSLECEHEGHIFKIEMMECSGKRLLKFSHIKGREEITSHIFKRLFNVKCK